MPLQLAIFFLFLFFCLKLRPLLKLTEEEKKKKRKEKKRRLTKEIDCWASEETEASYSVRHLESMWG